MADILTGLIGYWTFDNTPNDAVGSNHGTWTGTATYGAGKIGSNSASFAGAAQLRYIEMTTPASLSDISAQNHSVALWINANANSSGDRILSIQEDADNFVQFMISSTNGIQYICEDVGTQRGLSLGSVPTGEWVHLVGTWNAATDTVAFYVNASSQAAGISGAAGGTHTTMRVGGRDATANVFDGLIDELRIYDRVLPLEDVQALHAFTGATASITRQMMMHHGG